MSALPSSRLITTITPPLVLGVAHWAAPYLMRLPDVLMQSITFAPYLVFAVSFGLGVLFERKRTALASLWLLIVFWMVNNISSDSNVMGAVQFAAISIATLFIPLNLVVFAHFRDKGLWSWQGMLGFAIIVAQGALQYWAAKNHPELVVRWLNFEFFVNTGFQQYSAISQLAVFVYVMGFILLLKNLVLDKDVFVSGFLGVMVAMILACQAGPQRDVYYV